MRKIYLFTLLFIVSYLSLFSTDSDSTHRKKADVLMILGEGKYLSSFFEKHYFNGYKILSKTDIYLSVKSLSSGFYAEFMGGSVILTQNTTIGCFNFNLGTSNYHKRNRIFSQFYLGYIYSPKVYVTSDNEMRSKFNGNEFLFYVAGLNFNTPLLGYALGIKWNKKCGMLLKINGLLSPFLHYETAGHSGYQISIRYIDAYMSINFYLVL